MKLAHEKKLLVLAVLVTALAVSSWISGCAGFAEPLPPLSVSPSSLSISATPGSPGSQSVSVTNISTQSVVISAATVSGPGFSVAGLTTPLTLGPGQRQIFTVKFAAAGSASVDGSLSIVTDAHHRPLVLRMHGNGGNGVLTILPASAAPSPNGKIQFTAEMNGQTPTGTVKWSASIGSITSTGLYTAPANAGVGSVTASILGNSPETASATVTVTAASTSNPSPAGACPTTIAPSGSTDNSNWLTKMKAAVAAGTCVEITAGSYTLSANFTPPNNAQIVCDDDAVMSDTTGYGTSDVMLAFEGITGVTLTGTGDANECEFAMPNSYASNINNTDQSTNQYKHALEVSGGSDNIKVTRIHIKNAGGDGLYVANATNVTITNVLSEANIRNGGSATESFSGLTVQNSTFQNNVNANAGICVGFDDEPNGSTGPNGLTFTGNIMTGNDCSQIPGGLRLSIQNLSSSTPGVKIVINNNTATNNGGADYKEILPTSGLASSASVTAAGNVGSNGAVSLPFP
jgi:hypothetical protein